MVLVTISKLLLIHVYVSKYTYKIRRYKQVGWVEPLPIIYKVWSQVLD